MELIRRCSIFVVVVTFDVTNIVNKNNKQQQRNKSWLFNGNCNYKSIVNVLINDKKINNMENKKVKVKPNYSGTLRAMPVGSSISFDVECTTYTSLKMAKSRLSRLGYDITITPDKDKIHVKRNN